MDNLYDVIMTDAGLYRMTVALNLKEICEIDFSAAKQAVYNTPYTVKKGVTSDQAERIKEILAEAGAETSIEVSGGESPQSEQSEQPEAGAVTAWEMPVEPVAPKSEEPDDAMPSINPMPQEPPATPPESVPQSPNETGASQPALKAEKNVNKNSDANMQKTDVVLVSYGDYKLNVIKALKDTFGLSLKTSKEIVESAPCTLQKGIPYKQAVKTKKSLEKAGAKIMLK